MNPLEKRNKKIYNSYVVDKCSMAEIAKRNNISHQRVHQIIERVRYIEQYPDFKNLSTETVRALVNGGITNKEELFNIKKRPYNFGSSNCRELSLEFGVYFYINRKGEVVVDKNKKVLPMKEMGSGNKESNCIYM